MENGDEETIWQFDDADIRAVKEIKTKSLPPKIDKITVKATFSQVNFKGENGWEIQLDKETVASAPLPAN